MPVPPIVPKLFLGRCTRPPQNEAKVPIRPDDLPLKLRNHVTPKGSRRREKGCLQQITLLIACLSQNNYENNKCVKEVTEYQDCYKTYLSSKNKMKEEYKAGTLNPGAKNLRFNQVNQLLARYPLQ